MDPELIPLTLIDDPTTFLQDVHPESEALGLSGSGLNFIDIIDRKPSSLVREAAALLPYVCRWRGNFSFIGQLLGTLMACDVEKEIGRFSDWDSTRCWLPEVRYRLLIPGLTSEEYLRRTEELQPLAAFIREWFIPFEVSCRIGIKEHRDYPVEGGRSLTLDYNTEVKSEELRVES